MYRPSSKTAWKGRVDAQDGDLGLRWHQKIKMLDLSATLAHVQHGEKAFALLGFCCDEGVRRNQGREGAVAGPGALRSIMASYAYHLPENYTLYDAGDILCTNQNLEEAQEQLGKKVALLLEHGYRPIVLGGGHEIAYGHFLGLNEATKDQKLGILNFDAHFDLRSYTQQPSSGTPFLQIADKLNAYGRDFNYKVLGLQEYGNTQILFKTADQLGVTFTFAEEMNLSNLSALKSSLQAFLSKVDKVYITIDLDVFAAGYAPGVSAVNGLGIQPDIVLVLLKEVVQSGKLLSIDVAELNPVYDLDNRTAKLGAALLYETTKSWSRI
jgi:formiminoglutamase